MDASAAPAQPSIDLGPHLPLVGHVVRQLSLRLPPHLDRAALWNHGAVGLAAAAIHPRPGLGFGTLALRSIRANILDGARSDLPVPTDAALAELLSVPLAELVAARDAAVPAAPRPVAAASRSTAPQRAAAPAATRRAATIAYAS